MKIYGKLSNFEAYFPRRGEYTRASGGELLRRIIKNGTILTLSSLFLRLIGVALGAYVSAELGAEGMGLYTLIMSVYGFTVTLASSGVGLASTRLCSEARGKSARDGALRACLTWALVSGSLAGGGLFLGAGFVADILLGDARCEGSLRLLALSMPPIALSSALSGYFSAVRRVAKSAFAGAFEQVFKISVTVASLTLMRPQTVDETCRCIVGSGMLSECASFSVLYLFWRLDRDAARGREKRKPEGFASLRAIIIPVASAAIVRSALSTLEHLLIPRGLRKNPATAETALAAYGALCGMALPVIFLPTALLYSFTGLLIPELAEAKSRGDSARIERICARSLRLTVLFSLVCAGFMAVFGGELGELIYKSSDCGELIGLLAPLIPLMYVDHAVDAMLKGLGEQLYCMKVNIVDAGISVLLVWIFCGSFGIYGYILTLYLTEGLNLTLSAARLSSTLRPRPRRVIGLREPSRRRICRRRSTSPPPRG